MSRAKSLTMLKRLHDLSLAERSAELSELQTRLGRVSAARAELENRRAHEMDVDMVEAMPYIPTFLAHMRREDGKLKAAEVALEGHVERVTGQVMEKYRDLKSVENLQELFARRDHETEAARESAERDELTIIAYSKAVASQ